MAKDVQVQVYKNHTHTEDDKQEKNLHSAIQKMHREAAQGSHQAEAMKETYFLHILYSKIPELLAQDGAESPPMS